MTDQTSDEPHEFVCVDIQSHIAVLTLNRPDSRNALSRGMREAIIDALRSVSQQTSVHVIVLTGVGKAFCAGLDLKELQQDNAPIHPVGMGIDSPVVKAFRDCPRPIIGAINGYAVTGGFELALTCDFLYAAESAQFADTHALVGILPGWGLSQKLPRLVGINRAREISFTGKFFSAADAMAWGLVNGVFPDDQLMPKTLQVAQHIAAADPETLSRIRRVMNDGWEMTLRDGLAMEAETAGAFNSALSLNQMDERLNQLRERSRQ